MTNRLEDIRCGHCARKLAEGRYIELSIKCPRCGTLNHFRAESPLSERLGAPYKGRPDATR